MFGGATMLDESNRQQRDYSIRDAVLTAKGKEQCRALSAAFQHHDEIETVFASPLRRTIQTAALSFRRVLSRPEVPFVMLPALQEVSNIGCDVGLADSAADLQQLLPDLFEAGEIDFDLSKIDASAVTPGWNSKVGTCHWSDVTVCANGSRAGWLLGVREDGHQQARCRPEELAVPAPRSPGKQDRGRVCQVAD